MEHILSLLATLIQRIRLATVAASRRRIMLPALTIAPMTAIGAVAAPPADRILQSLKRACKAITSNCRHLASLHTAAISRRSPYATMDSDRSGRKWEQVEIDLSPFADQLVVLALSVGSV